ncbi:protein phosphatase 1 regulatory subunit 3G [Mixophyes fleayi]|uniref:protein phosphatase 1 regulatory subunit 3G n=1 Tax=Mixophyes fleayi TaxID=3061075 RepID=UPI003F4DFDC7
MNCHLIYRSHLELQDPCLCLHCEMHGKSAAVNPTACELCTEQLHNSYQHRQQQIKCPLKLPGQQGQIHELFLFGMQQQPQNMTATINELQHHSQEEELLQRGAQDVREQHCRPLILQLSSTANQEERSIRTALHSPGRDHLLQGVNRQLEATAVVKSVPVSTLRKCVQHLEEDPQGDLQSKLHGLNLGEQDVHSCNEEQPLHRSLRTYGDAKLHSTDTKYPEALATEESPRRRARSLPCNSIPEVDVEEEEDSLMCCCKLKKRVKFADSLGLTLASVKHFLASDEPLVPEAVLARLQSCPPTLCAREAELHLQEEMYGAEWVPPSIIPAELLTQLDEQGVCLEQVSSSLWGVRGCVLVKNPGEKAQVKIRYTFNEWLSFLDCSASAAEESLAPSTAPGSQRFLFNLNYPPSTSSIHFAICFNTGHGQELWDNNKGENYTVSFKRDLPPEIRSSSPEQEEWGCSRLW